MVPRCTITPLFCISNFKGIRCHFMVTFMPWWKEGKKRKRKKIKKLSQFLKVYISETPGAIYLNVECWRWRASPQQNSSGFVQAAWGYVRIRESCIFVLPVNILMGVALQLLGQHDIQPCVLMWCNIYKTWTLRFY